MPPTLGGFAAKARLCRTFITIAVFCSGSSYTVSDPLHRSNMAEDLFCACCKDPLSSTSEENQALACGHVFHKDCIDDYCQVANIELSNLECPLCKLSAPVVEVMAATTAVPLPENNASVTAQVVVVDEAGVGAAPELASTELPVPREPPAEGVPDDGTQQVCTLVSIMMAFVRPFVTAVTIRSFYAT